MKGDATAVSRTAGKRNEGAGPKITRRSGMLLELDDPFYSRRLEPGESAG